jgi:hypothetical protein
MLLRKESIGRSSYEGRVALIQDTKNTQKFLVVKPEGKRPLERPTHRNDIKIYPTK